MEKFDDALAVRADGVGFVFTDTEYTGVDLDGCLIDGKPTAEARQIIDALKSYTEKSPSGTGLHIIVKGNQVTVKIDGKTVLQYKEPPGAQPGKDYTRKLDSGTDDGVPLIRT